MASYIGKLIQLHIRKGLQILCKLLHLRIGFVGSKIGLRRLFQIRKFLCKAAVYLICGIIPQLSTLQRCKGTANRCHRRRRIHAQLVILRLVVLQLLRKVFIHKATGGFLIDIKLKGTILPLRAFHREDQSFSLLMVDHNVAALEIFIGALCKTILLQDRHAIEFFLIHRCTVGVHINAKRIIFIEPKSANVSLLQLSGIEIGIILICNVLCCFLCCLHRTANRFPFLGLLRNVFLSRCIIFDTILNISHSIDSIHHQIDAVILYHPVCVVQTLCGSI